MRKQIFFLAFFLILFSNFVMAQQGGAPQTIIVTNPNVNQLNILFPKLPVYNTSVNYTFNFEVYNNSNFKLSNTTASCRISIYELNGNNKYSSQVSYNNDTGDFYYEIDANQYTTNRPYYYDVNCNTTSSGGFISSSFSFMPNGVKFAEADTYSTLGSALIYLLLAAIFFAFPFLWAEINIAMKLMFLFMGFVNLSFVYYYVYITIRDTLGMQSSAVSQTAFTTWLYILSFLGVYFLALGTIYVWKWYRDKVLDRSGEEDEEE